MVGVGIDDGGEEEPPSVSGSSEDGWDHGREIWVAYGGGDAPMAYSARVVGEHTKINIILFFF